MKSLKNIFYYILGILIFVSLKLAFSNADNDQIIFLIKPLNHMVSLLTESIATYNNQIGFFHQKLNITIDKSCSGFNFWMLSFIMLFFTVLKQIKKGLYKFLMIPFSLLITYTLTLFVNTSRILVSLFIEKTTQLNYLWLHQAEGVFIYLSFLIIFQMTINYFQSKILKNYENLT